MTSGREVTDDDGITWTCIQAFAGLGKDRNKTDAARVEGAESLVHVVCTPSGGAKSVRVELPGGEPLTGTAVSVDRDGRLVVRAAGGTEHAVAAGDVTHAIALWEQDVHERGLGELPFPPDYPKMPGEPPRVQPSRARKGD